MSYSGIKKEAIRADSIEELAAKVKESKKDGWIVRSAFAIVMKGDPAEMMKHKYFCIVGEDVEEEDDNTVVN